MREYQVVPIDPEDVEEGIRDQKLASLRASGYRTVAVIPVEHKGKARLAFFLEPPTGPDLTREVPAMTTLEQAQPYPFLWRPRVMLALFAVTILVSGTAIVLALIRG